MTRTAAEGDASAQRELLRRALPFARHTARQLLLASQDWEDAVQASLLEVLRSAARFEGRSSLGTWVTRIAIRTTLRLLEKQRTLVPVEAFESETARSPDRGALEELPKNIIEYLHRLPVQQCEALVLRYCVDYSVDEIAEATETSRNTVKYRIKEALATMRRLVRRDLAIRGKRHD